MIGVMQERFKNVLTVTTWMFQASSAEPFVQVLDWVEFLHLEASVLMLKWLFVSFASFLSSKHSLHLSLPVTHEW